VVTEFAYLFIWGLSGLAIARALELRGLIAVPIGFALGIALFVALGVVQIVANVSTSPIWTLTGTLLVGLAVWLWKVHSRPSPKQWLALALSGPALALTVFGLRKLNWIGWHSDTFRYLLAGSVLGINRVDLLSLNLITKRMAVYPLLLAPASDSSELHFASLTPLLAVATLWILGWLLWWASSTRASFSRTERALAVVVVLALLVTNNRFVWHASYLNGHLVFAAYLLLLSGCGWLRVRTQAIQPAACVVIQSASAIVVALDRPEGPLVAALALLPFTFHTKLSRFERHTPMLALGSVLFVWYAWVGWRYIVFGVSIPSSCSGIWGLSVLLLAIPYLSQSPRLTFVFKRVLLLTELTLWVGLLGMAVRSPRILLDSLRAVVQNTVQDRASWGSSIWILALLVSISLIATRSPERHLLRFPVTTFVPLSFLLAYFRHEAYRDGDRDSLARMLFHFVPLSALLIGVSLFAEWRLPWRSRVSAPEAQI